LLNRRPHSALPGKNTPYEALLQSKPKLDHLRVFGCDAWMLQPLDTRKALDWHARRVVFIGVADNKNAYKLWDPVTRQIRFSRDVRFDESSFKFMERDRCSESMPEWWLNDPVSVSVNMNFSPPGSLIAAPEKAMQNDHVAPDEVDVRVENVDEIRDVVDVVVNPVHVDEENVDVEIVDAAVDEEVDEEGENADIVNEAAVQNHEIGLPRRCSRVRSSPGEWWKAPLPANRATAHWSPTVAA
jgi:hypothetical protein